MASKLSAELNLLIFGFVRLFENKNILSTNIPSGLIQIIIQFYPKLIICFGKCNKEKFEVLSDGLEIKGKTTNDCMGYLVYGELMNDNGFDEGINIWSIMNMKNDCDNNWEDSECYHNIGVISEFNDEFVNEDGFDVWPYYYEKINDVDYSFYDSLAYDQSGITWRKNDVITMILNCNEWTVSYYKNNDKTKPFQKDNINEYFKIVENPQFNF